MSASKKRPLADLSFDAPKLDEVPASQDDKKRPWNYKDPDDPTKVVRKTYLLTNEIINRIQLMAKEYGVGQNELVRHLLDYGLTHVDEGVHQLPVQQRNTLE